MNPNARSFLQGGMGLVRVILVMAILVFGLAAPALAAGDELATLNLGEKASYWGPVFIHYVPSLTTIINTAIPNESGFKEIRVAKLRLSARSTDTLIVDYTEGASADPGFFISLIEKCGPRRLDWPINGLDLEAPGDGYFYVRGHTDSWFDMRRKFTVEGGNLREVKQPFYYVGLETKTLQQIHIFSNQGCSEMMSGWIEAGSPVTVILSDGWTFLLKTDHDVLGWWRPQNISRQKTTEIEGLYYRGD
jgi:hypothetical protein